MGAAAGAHPAAGSQETESEPMQKMKAPPPVADINVTPMVDVMLVMLIIFMVITPMLSKGVTVDLVKTKNPIAMQAADKEDAVLVAVTREGKAFLGSTQINPADLPNKIRDMLTNRLDKTCYLKADSRARYERVVDVVNNMRAGGVDNLGLLTEQIQHEGAAAAGEGAAPVAQ
jgi:biopolymer transport protein ExbD/biopolymer transport protein TolR